MVDERCLNGRGEPDGAAGIGGGAQLFNSGTGPFLTMAGYEGAQRSFFGGSIRELGGESLYLDSRRLLFFGALLRRRIGRSTDD